MSPYNYREIATLAPPRLYRVNPSVGAWGGSVATPRKERWTPRCRRGLSWGSFARTKPCSAGSSSGSPPPTPSPCNYHPIASPRAPPRGKLSPPNPRNRTSHPLRSPRAPPGHQAPALLPDPATERPQDLPTGECSSGARTTALPGPPPPHP